MSRGVFRASRRRSMPRSRVLGAQPGVAGWSSGGPQARAERPERQAARQRQHGEPGLAGAEGEPPRARPQARGERGDDEGERGEEGHGELALGAGEPHALGPRGVRQAAGEGGRGPLGLGRRGAGKKGPRSRRRCSRRRRCGVRHLVEVPRTRPLAAAAGSGGLRRSEPRLAHTPLVSREAETFQVARGKGEKVGAGRRRRCPPPLERLGPPKRSARPGGRQTCAWGQRAGAFAPPRPCRSPWAPSDT
jgi:hypothetical protein